MPCPDLRDRDEPGYREYRDAVLRPDIRKRGIQVPLLAHPEGDKYRVFEGGSRLDCSILDGLKEIPLLVYPEPLPASELRKATFLANEMRKDFTPAERARFYLDTMRQENWSQSQFCREYGLNPPKVSIALKWLDRLHPDYRDKVGEGPGFVPIRGAYKICDWPLDQQPDLCERMMARTFLVEPLEELHAKTFGGKAKKGKPQKAKTPRGVAVQFPALDPETLVGELKALIAAVLWCQKTGAQYSSIAHYFKSHAN